MKERKLPSTEIVNEIINEDCHRPRWHHGLLQPTILKLALTLVLIVLAPLVLFLLIYWLAHPHELVDNATSVMRDAFSVSHILMYCIAALAIGFTARYLGLTPAHLLSIIREVKELFTPVTRVHAVNDNGVAYEGDLSFHDYRVAEVNEAPQIAPPQALSGRDLLQSGKVTQELAKGNIILGQDESGQWQVLAIKRVFSMIISGIPFTGKTTTVFWVTSQLIIYGARIWVVDPHMHFVDEDGNKSLAYELESLSASFVFPPCDDTPNELIKRVKWMYQQLLLRQKPGYIVRAQDTVIGVIDEFNSVADSIDKETPIIIHKGEPLNFAQTIALIEREGRKYGLHFMLIGHKWARQDIGGDNALRTNATTYLCHRVNDKGQAELLLGSEMGPQALKLTIGWYLITGSTWQGQVSKIRTPMISAQDIPAILEAKLLWQDSASAITSPGRPQGVQVTSAWRPQLSDGRDTENNVHKPEKPMDAQTDTNILADDLRSKTLKVLECDMQGMLQNSVIEQVWGIKPDTREGRAAKEELLQIRKYIAQQQRQQFR